MGNKRNIRDMKLNIFLIAALALWTTASRGQTIYGWDVAGINAVSNPNFSATTSASNITGGQLSLTGLSASSTNNTYGGSNWNLTDTFDDTNDYISFSVAPTSGYEVTYSSLEWDQGVTSTAPNTSRWGYKIGAGAFSLQTPFTVSGNTSNAAWDFNDFTSTDTVEFRFWTYGATSVGGGSSSTSGVSRIRNLSGDDLILYGSVAAIIPAGASMFWTADGSSLGGTGTWNATNTNWSANETPVSGTTWDSTKSAVFQGTADSVTVGTVSVDEGLIFGTTGYSLSSGTITLSGTASANNTITTQPSVTATLSSTLAGSNGMTKAGDGTLVLSGNNTYSGGTSISAGTLQLGDGSTSGSISGAITNDGVLAINRSDSLALGGAISGNGSLENNGGGTLTLSGSNTFSGGSTISNGTIRIGHNSALGTGNLTTTGNVTIASADSTARVLENSYTSISGSSITITLGEVSGGTGHLTFNGTGTLAIGSGGRTFEVHNTTTLKGGITNSGSITKTANGTLILAGSSSQSGATTITSGTLQAAAANALGSTSEVNVNGGSLLVTAGGSINDSAAINLGGGTLSLNGTFDESVGALTLSADSIIDLDGFNGTLTFASLGSWTAGTTLAITNWSGLNQYGTPVGSGIANRHVVFTDTTNLPTYLDRISFYSGDFGQGFAGTAFELGFTGEIGPVPEPEVYVTAIVLLAGYTLHLLHRRLSAERRRDV